mmetsp:Transcript_13337/g.42514  ORF Transcript_13337/g.42514 Transcript_13337/m.42514 type:complete len:125 (+) Transcript_13337:52-426(+)
MAEPAGGGAAGPSENPRAFLEIMIGGRPAGQLVFELRRDIVGMASENFAKLCTGELGLSKSGFELCYRGCEFHRIVPNQVCQTGDFTKRDGTGGESIFGPEGFNDESFTLLVGANRARVVLMPR